MPPPASGIQRSIHRVIVGRHHCLALNPQYCGYEFSVVIKR